MSFGPLVSAEWLREHLGQPGLVVVDCRYVLGEPGAGERLWREGHIPGATFLDLDRDLADPPGPGGRHPLPSLDRFAHAAGRAGIGPDSRVVAYDGAGEGGAARLWWLLRHFGHREVAVLDGALGAWDGPLEDSNEGPPASVGSTARAYDAERSTHPGDVADFEEIERARPRLLDARAPERYRGEVEPIDPVAGHIPGAENVPWQEVAPEGRFLAPEELRKRLGDQPFVAYCGSGVTACTLLVAAELAGIEARLYPGSWSEWSSRA